MHLNMKADDGKTTVDVEAMMANRSEAVYEVTMEPGACRSIASMKTWHSSMCMR